jgi:lipopolysaccharide transport system ATP-binding protein
MTTAIRVDKLGKQYRLGAPSAGYGSLRESLTNALTAPFRARRPDASFWALRGVSFEVEHGEVVGIIGRNGAGKSTLLKILSRITEPSEGRAEIRGRVGSLLEVGTGFHAELTGRENIFLNGAILGMRRAEITRKFDEIVAFAEVEAFLDTPVKRYSSGMYMRLAFAVAAHLEPDILVVDEVLAVGDAAFQQKCLGKMGAVAQQGRTILFVSHNMGAIRSLCARTVLLSHGQVERLGATHDVVSHYIDTLDARTAEILQENASRSDAAATITGFSVCAADGTPAMEVQARDGMTVVYRLLCRRPVSDVSVQFTLCDQDGYPLAHCNNVMGGQTIDLLPGEHEVRCTVPELPFRTGIYFLNIALFKATEQMSHVRQAVSVGIVNDAIHRNYAMPANAPTVVLRQQWAADAVEDTPCA